ncbi:hypothetical protein A4X13_0g7075 [Tilletia indica]|uniref:FHA domain-containing protein n=1 Tax=Tilletia indica TaxID=43049 RepID=A0A177TEJ2_9BASI|nr:hypothetical protein A4X13_0g7075 [Tilletia indica]
MQHSSILTFLNFTPQDPTLNLKKFDFILHPRLQNLNIINDFLLNLDFFVGDEAHVQLWQDSPALWSSRADVGIYVNGLLLTAQPIILHDGDIIAFPRRRYEFRTAVRFRVEVDLLELSCGVDLELNMVRVVAKEMREEEERGLKTGGAASAVLTDTTPTSSSAPSSKSPTTSSSQISLPLPSSSSGPDVSSIASRIRSPPPVFTPSSPSSTIPSATSVLTSPLSSPSDLN